MTEKKTALNKGSVFKQFVEQTDALLMEIRFLTWINFALSWC